jgi:hypothetical protein
MWYLRSHYQFHGLFWYGNRDETNHGRFELTCRTNRERSESLWSSIFVISISEPLRTTEKVVHRNKNEYSINQSLLCATAQSDTSFWPAWLTFCVPLGHIYHTCHIFQMHFRQIFLPFISILNFQLPQPAFGHSSVLRTVSFDSKRPNKVAVHNSLFLEYFEHG